MDIHSPAGEGAPGPAGLGDDPAAADPVDLLRAGGGGHPRVRRHRRPAVRQPLLRPTVGPRHRPAGRGLLHHRAGRPSSGCRSPTWSATTTSGGRPSARWCRRHLHRRLRRPVRDVAVHAPAVDGGAPCSCWPRPRSRRWPSASSSPWPPRRRPRCARSASPVRRLRRWSSAGSPAACCSGRSVDAAGYLHGPTVALTLIGPVCVIGGVMLLVGSRYVRRDITLVIEDVLERHAEGSAARPAARAGAAGPQPRLLLRRQPDPLRHQPGG